MGRLTGILGLLMMMGLAYAFSTKRSAIRLKTIVWGLGLQIVFALFVLKSGYGLRLFELAEGEGSLEADTRVGVLGELQDLLAELD